MFGLGNRIDGSVKKGMTSYAELHGLLTGSSSDAVTADIILNQGAAATELSRASIEGLISASKDGSLSVNELDSLRRSLIDGVMTDKGLSGILAQPADVRMALAGQFSRLWTMRQTEHDSHLDQPLPQRTSAFIESDNKRFIKQFVQALENNPGDRATSQMAAERLSQFSLRPLSEIEPALLQRTSPMVLRKPIGDASPEVQKFAAAMARGDFNEAIGLSMREVIGLENKFTDIRIDFSDLSNPEVIAGVVLQMDKIGFASGYEGAGKIGSIADLGRPIVVLPNGKKWTFPDLRFN